MTFIRFRLQGLLGYFPLYSDASLSFSAVHDIDVRQGVDGADGAPGSGLIEVEKGEPDDGGGHHHGEHPEGEVGDEERNPFKDKELGEGDPYGEEDQESRDQHGGHVATGHLQGGHEGDEKADAEIDEDHILQVTLDEEQGGDFALLSAFLP